MDLQIKTRLKSKEYDKTVMLYFLSKYKKCLDYYNNIYRFDIISKKETSKMWIMREFTEVKNILIINK
jgi:hypothetical protein